LQGNSSRRVAVQHHPDRASDLVASSIHGTRRSAFLVLLALLGARSAWGGAPQAETISIRIAENAAAGEFVARPGRRSQDVPAQWSIRSGNESGAFRIDPATGRVSIANPAPIDHEACPRFELQIVAELQPKPDSPLAAFTADLQDSGLDDEEISGVLQLERHWSLVIDVGDRPEPPRLAVPVVCAFSLDSNSTSCVALLAAVDPDHNDSLRWEIVDGDPQRMLAIDPQSGRLDWSTGSHAANHRCLAARLRVRVTDSKGLFDEQILFVSLPVRPVFATPVVEEIAAVPTEMPPPIDIAPTKSDSTVMTDSPTTESTVIRRGPAPVEAEVFPVIAATESASQTSSVTSQQAAEEIAAEESVSPGPQPELVAAPSTTAAEPPAAATPLPQSDASGAPNFEDLFEWMGQLILACALLGVLKVCLFSRRRGSRGGDRRQPERRANPGLSRSLRDEVPDLLNIATASQRIHEVRSIQKRRLRELTRAFFATVLAGGMAVYLSPGDWTERVPPAGWVLAGCLAFVLMTMLYAFFSHQAISRQLAAEGRRRPVTIALVPSRDTRPALSIVPPGRIRHPPRRFLTGLQRLAAFVP
jgi:hypothetical protein